MASKAYSPTETETVAEGSALYVTTLVEDPQPATHEPLPECDHHDHRQPMSFAMAGNILMTHVFMPYIAETNKYGITPLPIPVSDFWVPTAWTTIMEADEMEDVWENTQIIRSVTQVEVEVSGKVVRA
jgi:hypothetical protein